MSTLNFGQAIEALKGGNKVAREGWSGKGMWIVKIHPGNAMMTYRGHSYPMQTCIGIKTVDDTMQPGWVPSQQDLLAEDWDIVG